VGGYQFTTNGKETKDEQASAAGLLYGRGSGSPHHALFWPLEVKGLTMVGLVTPGERAVKLGRTSSDRECSKRGEPGPTVSGACASRGQGSLVRECVPRVHGVL
jgi:hypothetical protein